MRPISPPPLDITAKYCEPCAQWERFSKNGMPDPPMDGVKQRFKAPKKDEDAPDQVD